MSPELSAAVAASRVDRTPPYSEDAEKGVLGSVLLDAARTLDLCIERQLIPESFYVPAHAVIYATMLGMQTQGQVVDVLTLAERLRTLQLLEKAGGAIYLEQLMDATPTAAHAEFYMDIVRQKHLLRAIISCARDAEAKCFSSDESADLLLSQVEQAFLDITERQHGTMKSWPDSIRETIEQIEHMLDNRRGVTGLSTGFLNLDEKLHGLRNGEMIVLAARPSMGKTSLAMNIAENVALGKYDPDRQSHPVGIFSLEMSHEALCMRMLCAHAGVPSFQLSKGMLPQAQTHAKLMQSASVLTKARLLLDDTGGLDVMELRARARRMKKQHGVRLIVIDYLQLLQSREYARQGRQLETANISGNLKAMAKELSIPVLVLSQLSRAPDQRGDKSSTPKLSDLRDSGAIEQDADVVCMLRRPCMYPDDEQAADDTLAKVDVAKHRNGPTGEVELNFAKELMRFTDRTHGGVDPLPSDGMPGGAPEP